jgi:hypothetical protein
MEEQKYYTPALEDLRIGSEYDRQDAIVTDIWRPNKVTEWSQLFYVVTELPNGGIRVPYLTADQIEAEGWKVNDTGYHWFKENNGFKYQLSIATEGMQELEGHTPHCWAIQRHNPDPWIVPWFQVYCGTIRCVNDLRLISKLLGI